MVAGRAREGSLDAVRQDAVFNTFLGDCERRFLILAVLDDQVRLAVALVRRRPLRGYDAVWASSDLADTGLREKR